MNGVSIGAFLGPVLANIFMSELENIIKKKFLDNDAIKILFTIYRYIDINRVQ